MNRRDFLKAAAAIAAAAGLPTTVVAKAEGWYIAPWGENRDQLPAVRLCDSPRAELAGQRIAFSPRWEHSGDPLDVVISHARITDQDGREILTLRMMRGKTHRLTLCDGESLTLPFEIEIA